MHHLFNVVYHLQTIKKWANPRRVSASIDVNSFRLSLTSGDRQLLLQPRFLIQIPNGLAYTSMFTDSCRFAGWLPYERKVWPLAADKLAFKNFCMTRNVRVPPLWSPDTLPGDSFIIKPRRGSWGKGIKGPLFGHQVDQSRDVNDEVLVEKFITGRPTKIWYWNKIPVAIEPVTSPKLHGDGTRSIGEILGAARGNFDLTYDAEERLPILAWQGLTPDSIPSAGAEILLDFLYATRFDRENFANRNKLNEISNHLRRQLEFVGNELTIAITEDIRNNSLYTVDGVIDDDDNLWVLEMNCHPTIHPDIYIPMLTSVCPWPDSSIN